ncbi:MAG TPA: hypothetical protein VGC42_20990, partial [Kofleriaceae bacterium]
MPGPELATGGGDRGEAVARAPAVASVGKQGLVAAAAGGEPAVRPGGAWPVFAASGRPYLITSPRDPVQLWVVSDWIRHGAGFRGHGSKGVSPACAAELLGALGWVAPDRIEAAARHLEFDVSRRVVPHQLDASALFWTGMATSRPVVSRTRAGADVAIRLDDARAAPGTELAPDDAQREAVVRALAEASGLAPIARAAERLRGDPRFARLAVQSGVLLWRIDAEAGNAMFGFDAASDTDGPFTRWLRGTQDRRARPAQAKLALHNYYGVPLPGTLRADRTVFEAGQPAWFELGVAWPSHAPSAAEYEVVPMVGAGHAGSVALATCDWRIELVGDAGPVPVSNATRHTRLAELRHAFVLPIGRSEATFRLSVRAAFDAYFAPAELATTVEVRSTAAAMAQLRAEPAASLGARPVSEAEARFDVAGGGTGDDDHGVRRTGELPVGFDSGAQDAARAGGRAAERARLEAARSYLEARGGSRDAVAALDRSLAASRATDAALAEDAQDGWRPFALRGTYLSREDGVPSGALSLHSSVRAEAVHSRPRVDGAALAAGPLGAIAVQIRDLSHRFGNADLTFTGRGDSFEAALKAAFVDEAKAYPAGVIAIEAEELAAVARGAESSVGAGTGKMVGFQLGTDSRWKRVR